MCVWSTYKQYLYEHLSFYPCLWTPPEAVSSNRSLLLLPPQNWSVVLQLLVRRWGLCYSYTVLDYRRLHIHRHKLDIGMHIVRSGRGRKRQRGITQDQQRRNKRVKPSRCNRHVSLISFHAKCRVLRCIRCEPLWMNHVGAVEGRM